MKKFKEFNQEVYNYIYENYFENFKNITLELSKQKVVETKEIYNLILNVTDLLYKGEFDLRYFYKETISKRDELEDVINLMVSKYEQVEYKKINELYNDWRNMIHAIGRYIGDQLEEYIMILQKENIKNEELEEAKKELDELTALEKQINNI